MADDVEKLILSISAETTQISRALRRLEGDTGRSTKVVARDFERMGQQVESRVRQSIGRANATLASFGKGLVAGVFAGGVAGIAQQVSAVAKSIATVGDEAKRAGLSTRAFQELKFVAEQSRVGIDSLVDGIKELNLRADEWIITGAGPAAEAFRRLGYSAEELKAKLADPSALFTEIIGKLQKLDKAAQIRIADEIFGGTGGERFVQLIAQGEQGIRDTIQAANDLGLVMDDQLIQKADELDRKFNAVATTVGTGLKRAIVEAAGALDEFITKFRQFGADYQSRLNAAEMGALVGSMAGGSPVRTTPKGDRLGQPVNVPFSPLPAIDMNRVVQLAAARERIAALESAGSGGYRAIGPVTDTGDRAFGKYQVMGANIADWTKKTIGTALTSEQFLNNPKIQDQVFDQIFGGYIDRFGMEGAAQAWFGGPGAVGKVGRQDMLGTTVGGYGKAFMGGDDVQATTDAWAGLREQTEQTAAATQQVTDGYSVLQNVGITALNGLKNALADGKITGQEFLGILIDIVQQLITAKQTAGGIGGGGGGIGALFGGGGLLGGAIIPGILHKGGVAGQDGYGHGRLVSPSLFAGARRYHKGGVAGLQAGEVPAILQRGEIVLPRMPRPAAAAQQQRPQEVIIRGTFVDDNGVIKAQIDTRSSAITQAGLSSYDKRMPARVNEVMERQGGG